VAQTRKQLTTLSPEESRVLELILAGKTNKGIALELSVGLRTVESRRHTLMQKLHVDSLAELIQAVVSVKAQSAFACSSTSRPVDRQSANLDYPRLREAN
jgi:FixJ family two-component response regulator